MDAYEEKTIDAAARVKEILAAIKPLAAEYYRMSGKPLGVTSEVAEYVAAELLGLALAPPRTAGYDALRHAASGMERIQIKGRAYDPAMKRNQRIGTIKPEGPCDVVMLGAAPQCNARSSRDLGSPVLVGSCSTG